MGVVVEALRMLEESEAAMAELYQRFAESCGEEEASALFERLALGHLSRRNALQYQARTFSTDAVIPERSELPIESIQTLRARANALCSKLAVPALGDTVESALELERRSETICVGILTGDLEGGLAAFVASLLAGSRRHLDALAALAASLQATAGRAVTSSRSPTPRPALQPLAATPSESLTSAEEGLGELLRRAGGRLSLQLLESLSQGAFVVDRGRKILFWNAAAEHLSGFSAAEQVGRHCWNDGVNHPDRDGSTICGDDCPLLTAMDSCSILCQQLYLHHKDGHRLPVTVTVQPIRDGQGQVIGAIELFGESFAARTSRERVAELEKLALLDPLTGLANRRYLEVSLHARLAELQRYGWAFGIAYVDIDDFKLLNDHYGHQFGDRLLRSLATTLAANLRLTDLVGRWGGDEFLAILANVTDQQLAVVAQRLGTMAVDSAARLGEARVSTPVSIGTTLGAPRDTIETLIERADRWMYKSKRASKRRAG